MIEGSGSESIALTSLSGSESRRPQNKWIRIRIRIRNTAYNEFARCSEPASLHGSCAGCGHQHHGTDGERDLSSAFLSFLNTFPVPFPISGHQHHGTDGERDLSSGSVPPLLVPFLPSLFPLYDL
jgi:hypothetical protein